MTERERLLALVDKCARELGEHFEAVQILASFTDRDGSHNFKIGSGNWYARQGMAREFIDTDQAKCVAWELSKQLHRDDEDDEDDED